MRRFLAATIGLVLAIPAHAGGIGLLMTGGLHTEKTWYYSDHAGATGGGEGVLLTDPADYEQFTNMQTLPQVGTGLELVLGDRDDRFIGSFRFYLLNDNAQKDPASLTTAVKSDYVVATYREKARMTGVGSIGLGWSPLDLSDTMRLGVAGHVGSGFLTTDHTEYLIVDLGPSYTWRASRNIMLVGDLDWQFRHHKVASNGLAAMVTARYMFD